MREPAATRPSRRQKAIELGGQVVRLDHRVERSVREQIAEPVPLLRRGPQPLRKEPWAAAQHLLDDTLVQHAELRAPQREHPGPTEHFRDGEGGRAAEAASRDDAERTMRIPEDLLAGPENPANVVRIALIEARIDPR